MLTLVSWVAGTDFVVGILGGLAYFTAAGARRPGLVRRVEPDWRLELGEGRREVRL